LDGVVEPMQNASKCGRFVWLSFLYICADFHFVHFWDTACSGFSSPIMLNVSFYCSY